MGCVSRKLSKFAKLKDDTLPVHRIPLTLTAHWLSCSLTHFPPNPHSSHIQLANLRAPGDKGYKIPRGFLFDYITCANYTAEIWGWILFTIGVQAVPAALFALAGGYQMTVWALQKHKRLRKVRGAVGNVLEGSSGKGARQGLMGG